MKTNTLNRNQTVNSSMMWLLALAGAFIFLLAPTADAANQTWTNAPVDPNWINTNNWVLRVVPGALNSTTITDVVTFNSPIFNGIGGAGNAITNDLTRGVRGFVFDTAACGAYVFGNTTNDNWLEINDAAGGPGGAIIINAPVVNPIVFNVPLRTRLPSSQNMTYGFTNFATAPAASLYISALTNTSANTRPLTLFLDGVNAGANTIARIDDQLSGSGAILIIKQNTGRWILSGSNDLPQKTSAGVVATVQVNNGTLEVENSGAFGGITQANTVVQTNGTLLLDGITITNGAVTTYGFTLRNGGTIRMNGSGALNALAIGNAVSTVVTFGTTSATDTLTIGNAASKLTGGAVDTLTHVNGPGTNIFAFSSTYAGKWSFDAGTVQLADLAALGAATAKIQNIAAGVTLDVSPVFVGGQSSTFEMPSFGASGTSATVGSTAAVINAGAGGTNGTVDVPSTAAISLTYTPTSFNGDAFHPAFLVTQGTLSLNGNAFNINNAGGSPLGAGTYLLAHQVTGNITSTGGPYAIVSGAGVGAGLIGEIAVINGDVTLMVSPHVSALLTWKGGNPDSTWDKLISSNWLAGGLPAAFNTSDAVMFDATGVSSPNVNLVGTLLPSSVKVDTTSVNYTFSGSGQIAGGTGLLKIGTGTLLLQTANTYNGGTVISNGALSVGIQDAISDNGASNLNVISPGILDLNGFNQTITGLTGNGTVDVLNGGAATLSFGNNDATATFTGVIQNTAGPLNLTKIGLGTEVLSGNNTYTGATSVENGKLQMGSAQALSTNANLVVDGGILDLNGHDLTLATFGGAGGAIQNNTGAATNFLKVISSAANTYSGIIANNGGAGGKIGLFVSGGGNLRLNGASTFGGGTIVDTNTTLSIGGGAAQIGTNGIVCSNGVTIASPNTASATPNMGNTITTVDNAVVTFTSGSTANTISGQFVGSALATNLFTGNMSISGATSFSNFLGTVIISNFNGSGLRMFNGGGGVGGGDNTTFDFETGFMYSRDASTIKLGALTGASGGISGPSVTPYATFSIGAKNLSTVFSGTISGSNNIVKVGTGSLTLNAVLVDGTYTDNISITNSLYDPATQISYLGTTTVSNGTLALIVPNNLTNSPVITLAGATAILDASAMGYISNLLDGSSTLTNTLRVTNGLLEIGLSNVLQGFGTIKAGKVQMDIGSLLLPGNTLGNLTPNFFTATNASAVLTNIGGTGVLTVNGPISIAGAVTIALNRTNAVNAGELSATSIAIDQINASLTVTNVGPTLQGGDVFHLFNQAVNFTNVVLPPDSPLLAISNRLAIDGTLVAISLVKTNATNITFNYNSGTRVLNLSWPADHTGWRLQGETNGPGIGVTTNWVTVAGSTNVNTLSFTNAPTNGSVFFRMVFP